MHKDTIQIIKRGNNKSRKLGSPGISSKSTKALVAVSDVVKKRDPHLLIGSVDYDLFLEQIVQRKAAKLEQAPL